MKRLLYFFLLIISSPIAAQQQRKLDSLKAVLKKLPPEGSTFGSDTTRVRVLCEMGGIENNDSLKINIFKKSLILSKSNNWSKGEVISLLSIGVSLSNQGKIFEGIDNYYKSLSLAEKNNFTEYIIKNYRHLGDAYWILNNYQKSIEKFEKALTFINPQTQSKLYLLCLNNIGLVYYKTKNYSKSLTIFNKCYLEAKKKNDSLSQSYYLGNIGAAYRELGEFDKALQYLHSAEKIEDKLPNLSKNDRAFAYIEIARAYFLKKGYPTALKYASKAKQLGDENDSYTQASIYSNLYEIHKALKNEKLALSYFEKYNEIKSLSDKQDFDRRLKGLQFEYDNQKQQTEIIELNQTQRLLGIGLGVIALFLLVFFISNWVLRKKNNLIENQKREIFDLNQNLEQKVIIRTEELSLANEELLRKNDEIMSALVEGQTLERKRVAVELHDNLGGMLSGMRWRLQALNKDKLSEKEQKVYEGILSMMSDAYSEVRLISHNMLPAEFEKRGLVGALEKLVNDINQSGKIQFNLSNNHLNGTLNKKISLELYGICLELVNNIIKHSQASTVWIKLYKENAKMFLEIKDNGVGFNTTNFQNDGMGLGNIKKRVESINGTLSINSAENEGTEIKIAC